MSFNPRRRRRFVIGGRKSKKNIFSYLPSLITVGLVLGLIWIIFKSAQFLFSTTQTENISAEIDILGGKAEAHLMEIDKWNPVVQGQKFFGGDSVRTNANGRLLFTFFDVNYFYLDKNSELFFEELSEKSSGKKTIKLTLKKGRIWVKSSESTFSEETKSQLSVKTDQLNVLVRSGIFDLNLNNAQQELRLIKGHADISVLKPNSDEIIDVVSLELGQKLVLNEKTLELLKKKEDVRDLLDNEFIESDWHLRNLEKFAPQEVQKIRRKIEINTAKPALSFQTEKTEDLLENNIVGEGEIPAPQILTPAQNTHVTAEQDLIKIEGTAPSEAFQISVNGYYLSKFQAGDAKWSYFGATKFNTLVPGENKYIIQAISRDGKKSKPVTLTIFYDGTAVTQTTTTQTISDIHSFTKPQITSPAFFVTTPTDTYQTSSSILTLKGTVDAKTNRVEVNGFVLQKFKPGMTNFSYIANADYGNLKEGLNVFKIKAFGPDNKSAITEIRVVYSPIEL
jgi:hypothetical protein